MSEYSILIEIQEKRYAPPPATTVLKNFRLEVSEGEVFTVLGPSGCGKSTLLRLVAGLDRHFSGRILINDVPVSGPNRNVGMLFQESRLLPWFTVRQNVDYALARSMDKGTRRTRVDKVLELVGLAHATELLPKELSGGMARRAALARAVVNVPAVLLLDEPFSALDPLLRQELQQAISDVADQDDLTVLLVTHDVDEAVFMSDRIAVLSGSPGQIARSFTVDLGKPRQRLSSAFAKTRSEVLQELLNSGASLSETDQE